MRFAAVGAVTVGFLTGSVLSCQSTAQPQPSHIQSAPEVQLPVTVIDLSDGKSLLNLPPANILGYPLRCGADGSSFMEIYANQGKPQSSLYPELYRVSTKGEAAHIARLLPEQQRKIVSRDIYIADHEIVTLFQTGGKIVPGTPPDPKAVNFFLSSTDLDGGSPKITQLALPFEPQKIAAFDSGERLVLGVDQANQVPVLALIKDDGTLIRRLDLDERQYLHSKGKSAQEEQGASAHQTSMLNMVGSAFFVPDGPKVLLVQPGTGLPVRVFSLQGEERAVKIALPTQFLVENVIGSPQKDTWLVRAQQAKAYEKFDSAHISENPVLRLFEVDKFTGTLIRELQPKLAQPSDITCVANRKIYAIYYGPAPSQKADENSSAPAPTQPEAEPLIFASSFF
jgi:hypothetical protein